MSKLPVAAAAVLLVLLASRSGAADQCGLVGYDLSTLQEADYWTLRVDNVQDCVLPLGLTEDEIDYCDIFVSICRPLGNDTCPDHENSTTCQKVVPKTGNIVYYYDMGTYVGNDEFSPINGNITGFQALRVGTESESEECNGTIITFLDFICDPDANWTPNTVNITQFVISVEQLFNQPCSYFIKLRYSGGCYVAPTLSPSRCSIGDYDTATVSSRDYWTATVDATACYGSGQYSCVMYLAFCHPVPPEVGDSCYNSAICQKGYSEDDYVEELSMGSFTNHTQFYENDENNGFRMRVENGSKPENGTVCKNGLQTEVILVCDETKQWNSQDISEFVQLVYHHGEDPCMYVLKISYNGACIDSGRTVSKASPVGWIFIGLFCFAAIAYLAIGSAVMYFVKGARGVRVIPNFEFWKQFFLYTLEGCRYFLDIITCFQFDGKVPNTARRQPDYDKI